VKRRALPRQRLRNRAWALVAALLPATEGWSMDDPAVSPVNPNSASNATEALSSLARPEIPPPRRLNLDLNNSRKLAVEPSRPKIPPPRRLAVAPSQQPLAVQTQGVERPSVEVQPPVPIPIPSNALLDQGQVSEPKPDPTAAHPSDETVSTEPKPGPAVARPAEEHVATESMPAAPLTGAVGEPFPPGPNAEPAPMPQAVSQALTTLTGTPALDANPALTSPAAPSPAAPSPEPAPTARANQHVPDAGRPVDPDQKPDSNASKPASPGHDATSVAGAPDIRRNAPAKEHDDEIEQVGCATCGGYHSIPDGGPFHASLGCENGTCIPGRQPCDNLAKDSNTFIGAFVSNLYNELCCPDPCYQPSWDPAANASFFADYARPRTVTRFRYDNLEDMTRPDRNQFWIQQVTLAHKNTKKF
jgi:hypothetical protein